MKKKRLTSILFLFGILGMGAVGVHSNTLEGTQWDGYRGTPVHRIPLLDEDGLDIVPEKAHELPFSVEHTCGPCHEYSTISGGLHFSSSSKDAPAGRPGEPWIWVDRPTGTWLPMSYRRWPGVWRPDELGISPWRFTQLFGRHMPGGDMAEPADDIVSPESRWDVSGKVEINCLGCHNGSPQQDQSTWAIQMARENFRWAATAASGLGDVTGMASRMHDAWLVYDGLDPDNSVWALAPTVRYDLAQFDSKRHARFDIAHKPPDERCLYCHSAAPAIRRQWEMDTDVHSAAGMQCADCHRNGLDHKMIRGYEQEWEMSGDRTVAQFTCSGCHLGTAETRDGSVAAGRFGAPRPKHSGLPAVHIEKLTCTVCHSGARPTATLTRVRTSRANRLGIYGKARWDTAAPYIGEPVFAKGEDGKLTPCRIMWPAFWARLNGAQVEPLLPDDVAPVARGILDAEEQTARVLAAFSVGLAELASAANEPEAGGEAVLVAAGKVYHCNVDGRLDVVPYAGDAAVAGPVWAREVNGSIVPLVPDIDPAEPALDVDVEMRILALLGALELDETLEAEPVVMRGNKVYRRTFEGLLETFERNDVSADALTWGWLEADSISPLVPAFVLRAVMETAGVEQSFTEEQVALMLKALADGKETQGGSTNEFGYVSGGKLFRLDSSGALIATDSPAAEPYLWPIAHDVRPATRSLGATSCAECHATNAPFFFGTVEAYGPLRTENVASMAAYELQEIDPTVTRLFGWTFRFRPLLKTVGFCASALVFAVLLLYGLAGLRVLCKRLGQREY